jgi:polygalacturonase
MNKSILSALVVGIVGLIPMLKIDGQEDTGSLNNSLYNDLPFKMEVVKEPVFSTFRVNIKDYGAVNDGVTSNTKAFAAAIDEVVKKGGGTVVIPEGLWLTGPIILKSNVNLFAEKGALVRFTSDYNEYPLVQTSYEGETAWRAMSPINAEGAENIAITGQGVFDGNGDAWRPLKKNNIVESRWKRFISNGGKLSEDKTTWFPSESAANGHKNRVSPGEMTQKEAEDIKGFLRPVMLSLVKCKRILIDGVTFQNPPAWTLHPLLSEDIIIRNIRVHNEEWQTNADALDLESCRNAVIYNCIFDAGDDAICMKSGRDAEGRKRGVPTENVIITHCSVYKGHGGFVIGSEMSGGVRNIKVSHCTFMGTDNGLRFKSTRGRGGIVENIYLSDINMVDIERDAVLYDLYYAVRDKNNSVTPSADESTPQFRNIFMKNIVCKGADRAILFQGLPEMNLENITIENAVFETRSGIYCSDANNITLKNLKILTRSFPVIDINNAKNIRIENFKSTESKSVILSIAGEKAETITIDSSIKSDNIKVDQNVRKGALIKKN